MKRATFGVACVVLLGMLLACAGPAAKVRTRDELKKEVVGKTPDEVLALLGKPESTNNAGGVETWRYEGVSRDPNTDKVDMATYLDFDQRGRVKVLRFTP